MAEPAASGASSESMEDILQSIKRIIEDEPAAEKKPAAEADVLDLAEFKEEVVAAAPVVAPPPAPPPTAAPAPKTASTKPMETPPAAPSTDGLVSDEAATAAAAALKPIVDNTQKDLSVPRVSSPQLRNGNTVEDLMLEALRPMLKGWLDENLPLIVQKIVEKEVKRIITFRQD